MMLKLSDFDAITFDVYGTLIDCEPSIIAFLRRWTDQIGVFSSGEDLIRASDGARAEIRKSARHTSTLRSCADALIGSPPSSAFRSTRTNGKPSPRHRISGPPMRTATRD